MDVHSNAHVRLRIKAALIRPDNPLMRSRPSLRRPAGVALDRPASSGTKDPYNLRVGIILGPVRAIISGATDVTKQSSNRI